MKKIFFLATFLLCAGSASATQMKVVCCDGSVHYFQAVSLKDYALYYKKPEDVAEYAEILGRLECKECCNGCYKSVTDLNYGTAQVSHTEDSNRLEAQTTTSINETSTEA